MLLKKNNKEENKFGIAPLDGSSVAKGSSPSFNWSAIAPKPEAVKDPTVYVTAVEPSTTQKQNTGIMKRDNKMTQTEEDNMRGLLADALFRDSLLNAQIEAESSFDPQAVSSKGAIGLTQVMPETKEEIERIKNRELDLTKPKDAIYAQKVYFYEIIPHYLSRMRYIKNIYNSANDHEKLRLMLAAYNAGVGTVQKAIKKATESGEDWLTYMPSETKNYVSKILSNAYSLYDVMKDVGHENAKLRYSYNQIS